jgi:SPP1 family holin
MKVRTFLANTLGKLTDRVDWLNVPTGTYVRYILAILAAVNTLLNVFGLNPINADESQLYDSISAILFIAILFVNTYKDNPTSPEAIESNKFMKMLKAQNKETKESDS